ncbi:membrane protein insertase YidC [Weissella muntiaci]|uniref:Membrane protein insertase YidC n=1 Tax=Weissella muntiaci TaxID=2508881 RepID=A0A6C2C9A6_9LACO|nr:membrane protein insertase YidC [Weissella muntiaci]TYC50620.1 membrane protein insertase YidC [Weissella muntiaci]
MKIKGLTPILMVVLVILMITGKIGFLQVPLTDFMEYVDHAIGGVNAIGWSIVILTVVVRTIMLPLMVHQQRLATIQQEKMRMLQPQLTKVQAAQKAATNPADQQRASAAMMSIYRENNVSLLGGMNFAALIIQWPIFFGLYQAIQHAKGISSTAFFGITLGDKSITLAIATAAVYALQSWLSMIGVPKEQKKQMATMMYMMPIMMFFMTYVTNAGIALYFFVGAIMVVIQTLIIVIWRPRLRRNVENSFEVKDVVDDALAGRLESAAPKGAFARAMQQAQESAAAQSPKDIDASEHETDDQKVSNRERNAGRQSRDSE